MNCHCGRPIRAHGFCKWHLRNALRAFNPIYSLTISDMTSALRELYEAAWPNPMNEIRYRLLRKFKDQLPHRQKETDALYAQAKIDGQAIWRSLVYKKNPCFNLIPKETNFKGNYFPVPIGDS